MQARIKGECGSLQPQRVLLQLGINQEVRVHGDIPCRARSWHKAISSRNGDWRSFLNNNLLGKKGCDVIGRTAVLGKVHLALSVERINLGYYYYSEDDGSILLIRKKMGPVLNLDIAKASDHFENSSI